MATHPSKPRVLIFSQRNIFRQDLFRCPLYEFEDTICQIDSADVVAPPADPSGRRHNLARQLAFRAPVILNPGVPKTEIKANYDLFFAICGAPGDLLMVNTVTNWKDTCKRSICLLDEFWVKQMGDYRHFLPVLRKFDVVMLYYSQSVTALSQRIDRPCVFLPPGADAITFCPFPAPPPRVVDVYSIGRRSETTHQALLRMANDKGTFYLHDSIAGNQAIHSKEHRKLFANVIKRSKYFIVNPGLIDRPDRRGDQIEIGNRYFEGAAAGAIMIGEHPDNEEFRNLFDWPDAVVRLPYNSDKIDATIETLEHEPDRLEAMRKNNVRQSLLRHDWVYRWEAVLKTAGLQPMPGLDQRKRDLQSLANGLS